VHIEYRKGICVVKYNDFEIASIYYRSLKYLIVVSTILFSFFYKNLSYALGFVLGGTACLVNFNLMIKSLEGMVSKTNYSRAFFTGHFLLRLLIVTIALLGALMLESVSLLTTVAGILTIRIVITWEAITKHIKRYKNLE
jgi:hypothetical protein